MKWQHGAVIPGMAALRTNTQTRRPKRRVPLSTISTWREVDTSTAPAYAHGLPTFILGGGVHGRLFLYDVFSGVIGEDALWIEAVSGLSNARKRMEDLAAAAPGRYFVFRTFSQSVVALIDTRESASSLRKAKSA